MKKTIFNNDIFIELCKELQDILFYENNKEVKINIYFYNKNNINDKYLLNIKEKFLHHLFGMQYIEIFYEKYSTKSKNQKTSIFLKNFLKDVVSKKILWTSLEQKIYSKFKNKSFQINLKNPKELIKFIQNKILGFYLLITYSKKFNWSEKYNIYSTNIFNVNEIFLTFTPLIHSRNIFVLQIDEITKNNYYWRTFIPKSMRVIRKDKINLTNEYFVYKIDFINIYIMKLNKE